MRIHHLNCGSLVTPVGKMLKRHFSASAIACHCLLVETNDGLLLVDTGFGANTIEDPDAQLGRKFVKIGRPRLSLEETALHQVRSLGFSRDDVRHIIPTHLDVDHAAGLSDFPDASVHVLRDELIDAMARPGLVARERYRQAQWAHDPHWVTYDSTGESWQGFDNVRQLHGLPPEVLLVPLPGHTNGQCGVALRREEDWLLHAGDAYWIRGQLDPAHPLPTSVGFLHRSLAMNRQQQASTLDRLRDLVCNEGSEVRVISAHDPREWKDASR